MVRPYVGAGGGPIELGRGGQAAAGFGAFAEETSSLKRLKRILRCSQKKNGAHEKKVARYFLVISWPPRRQRASMLRNRVEFLHPDPQRVPLTSPIPPPARGAG